MSDLLPALSIAISYAILFMLHLWHGARRQFVFYLLFAAGMLAAAWISRLESGSYANVLFPAYACTAMLFGLGLHVAAQLLRSSRSHAARIGEATLLIAAFLQFVALTYNPRWMLPSTADRQAGNRLVATLAQIPGEIWVPYHGYLPTPHQHELGGYETWLGTCKVQEDASVVIVDQLLAMLAELSSGKRGP